MREIILLNLSGPDRAGVTSSITKILSRYAVTILDIGQAVIHDNLNLGMLLQLPDESESAPILKDVLFCAHELGMQVRFTPISHESYNRWLGGEGKPRYIITLLARRISAAHLNRVTAVVADNDLNIDKISRLSGRVPLAAGDEESRACVEFSVRGVPRDPGAMRGDFLRISAELGVDIAFQKDDVFRRNRRLVCFDMDSTLIETEVIDELARAAGVGDRVAAITERAMQGELDFQASFRERVALLKGLPETVLAKIAQQLPLTEGAERLTAALRGLGFKTAILSGGFNYFGNYLRDKLGIDYVFANELEVKDGHVTGNVVEPIVDGARKAELLRGIAEQENLRLEQVIAVGDGANDLPMLNLAGLGIAFRAKPLVRETAEQSISTLGLDGILYLIGVRDRDEV